MKIYKTFCARKIMFCPKKLIIFSTGGGVAIVPPPLFSLACMAMYEKYKQLIKKVLFKVYEICKDIEKSVEQVFMTNYSSPLIFSDILHEKRGNIQYKHGVTLAPPLLTKRNIQ